MKLCDLERRRLMSGVAQGDEDAFCQLYDDLSNSVFRFVCRRVSDQTEALDITSEVFLQVWRAASTFQGRSAVSTWIFSIAYRKSVDHIRRESRIHVMERPPEQIDEAPAAWEKICTDRNALLLSKCMEQLSEEHRLTIEYAFFHDFSYREISEIMAVPEGTVKTRAFHAKRLLKHNLDKVALRSVHD